MDALEKYLADLHAIRSTGAAVPETSGYPALRDLLDAFGKTLKPKVRCIINLANAGVGLPDGGLLTADQFQRTTDAEPLRGQKPSRGAIEVKPTGEDVWGTARSHQVRDYLSGYGLVLVTNYRDFLLVEQDEAGEPRTLESYRLADDETAFWALAAHPRRAAETHGERLGEFLRRVMLHNAPLGDPKDVAWFLASYAREALARVDTHGDLPALQTLRQALAEGLGIAFEGAKGEHFFRSTLVQTLFYGVFSAWVLWHKERPDRSDTFDWRTAEYHLSLPVLQALFGQVSAAHQVQPLGLVEVLDWAGAALGRVDREAFFQRFEESRAVQYFYEPFLEAFDPQLRKDLGVWYTPPDIVQYQVARVDRVLREEMDIPDGLADPRVVVLDPCAGTGTYLLETLKTIAVTLRGKGEGALVPGALRQAAAERVFGFEILPAPFVVAHLQIGLLLQGQGARLPGDGTWRPGMYLTNALTGWTSHIHGQDRFAWPELETERDLAEHVKREAPVLVILGNPPYNAFAGISPKEEGGLVDVYKDGLVREWKIKKFNLDDLYVRFFRMAERRIAEMTGRGVVSFISNFSYLRDASFVVMRKRFLGSFGSIWIDCMNGDSRETGKLTPEGEPDPSVFSTETNRVGIRVGTAICVMVRNPERGANSRVRFRHFWGVTKRADLLASLNDPGFDAHYQPADPKPENRFSFRPQVISRQYDAWPSVEDLTDYRPTLGVLENRKGSLIQIDRCGLEQLMMAYLDATVDWESMRASGTGLTQDAARFDARKTRAKLLDSEPFRSSSLRRLVVRPMDTRWCYWSAVRPLWNEPRPGYEAQCWAGNAGLVSRRKGVAVPEGRPFFFVSAMGAQHAMQTDAYFIPIQLRLRGAPVSSPPAANGSQATRAYLAALGLGTPDADKAMASLLWMHALAIGYSPAYLAENADGIRQDWPRIPLPKSMQALEASTALGRQVAALLDTEAGIPGVTDGAIRPELRSIAMLTAIQGGAPELALTAGWGHAGKGGVTMPGRGRRVERAYSSEEKQPIEAGAAVLGLKPSEAFACLGKATGDVFLNETTCWKNVPQRVWDYTIGGYQVMKKWLSYREQALLGRPLTNDEAREVMHMARRLAALTLLEPTLDANYKAVKKSTYDWPNP